MRNSQYCVCNPSFWSKTRNENIGDDAREARYGAVAKIYYLQHSFWSSLEKDPEPLPGAPSVLRDYFTPDLLRNYDIAVMAEASSKPVLYSSYAESYVKLL
ncbi:unnamed protein product [Strongylus vulgaris]|uniref:Uncharacterized protein n=1 Tax=Strongylus vulgaris TaxID=40348 RepID=A0A3P7INC9_STRVU|nr:unnamed protein product [Strongylus vulgaris]